MAQGTTLKDYEHRFESTHYDLRRLFKLEKKYSKQSYMPAQDLQDLFVLADLYSENGDKRLEDMREGYVSSSGEEDNTQIQTEFQSTEGLYQVIKMRAKSYFQTALEARNNISDGSSPKLTQLAVLKVLREVAEPKDAVVQESINCDIKDAFDRLSKDIKEKEQQVKSLSLEQPYRIEIEDLDEIYEIVVHEVVNAPPEIRKKVEELWKMQPEDDWHRKRENTKMKKYKTNNRDMPYECWSDSGVERRSMSSVEEEEPTKKR